jgi:hypothetical protein
MTDLPDRILEAIEPVAQNAEELNAAQPTLMRIGLSTPDGRSLVVSSDPRVTLRRCEADRRTVERHALRGKSVLRNGEFVDYCAACQQPIPCPDLLDRAHAYDVARDGETT